MRTKPPPRPRQRRRHLTPPLKCLVFARVEILRSSCLRPHVSQLYCRKTAVQLQGLIHTSARPICAHAYMRASRRQTSEAGAHKASENAMTFNRCCRAMGRSGGMHDGGAGREAGVERQCRPPSMDLLPRRGHGASGHQHSTPSRRTLKIAPTLPSDSVPRVGCSVLQMPFIARVLAGIGASCVAQRDEADSRGSRHAGLSGGQLCGRATNYGWGGRDKGCGRGQLASRHPPLEHTIRSSLHFHQFRSPRQNANADDGGAQEHVNNGRRMAHTARAPPTDHSGKRRSCHRGGRNRGRRQRCGRGSRNEAADRMSLRARAACCGGAAPARGPQHLFCSRRRGPVLFVCRFFSSGGGGHRRWSTGARPRLPLGARIAANVWHGWALRHGTASIAEPRHIGDGGARVRLWAVKFEDNAMRPCPHSHPSLSTRNLWRVSGGSSP